MCFYVVFVFLCIVYTHISAPLVISKFTFEQIETMIAGMNKGKFYNYRGMEALPGEHRLRMDQLLRLKSKVQPSGLRICAVPV